MSHGLLAGHRPPDKEVLLRWLDNAGVYVSPALEVCDMEDGDGWRVVTKAPIQLNEILCQIPKTALLSARSSSLPLITASGEHMTNHTILHLSLVLLHELRLGADSRWYGYLQSLPRDTVLLPLFWGMEELAREDGSTAKEWLRGTEAERDLQRKDQEGLGLADLKTFYTSAAPLLPPTAAHPDSSPFSAYLHAYSLITTRAFLIDLYHTVALTPFADLFNHSSLPHTSLASDDFVCHICGSLGQCSHDIIDTQGGAMRLSHLPEMEARKLAREVDTVDMRLERDLDVGEEVFNTYGDMGDARLLVEWGFITGDFARDGMTWSLDDLGGSQDVREDWIRIMERGRLSSIFTFKQDEDEDGVLLAGVAKGGAETLSLSQAGLISIGLWVYALLLQLGPSLPGLSPEQIEAIIANSVRELEHRWSVLQSDDGDYGHGHDTSLAPLTFQTAVTIRGKLKERLEGMHRSELSLEQLFDLHDSLPPQARMTRMAITLSINERSLLLSTLDRWRDLLDEQCRGTVLS